MSRWWRLIAFPWRPLHRVVTPTWMINLSLITWSEEGLLTQSDHLSVPLNKPIWLLWIRFIQRDRQIWLLWIIIRSSCLHSHADQGPTGHRWWASTLWFLSLQIYVKGSFSPGDGVHESDGRSLTVTHIRRGAWTEAASLDLWSVCSVTFTYCEIYSNVATQPQCNIISATMLEV